MAGRGNSLAPFVVKLSVAALIAFGTVTLAMSFSQADLLFPTHAVPSAGPFPVGAERLEARTADGETLHGVHLAPSGQGAGSNDLIIGFGGNAWNGQDVAEELGRLFPAANIVAFHYRGYRPSTGEPSARALIGDAPLVYDAAVKEVPGKRIVAAGFSIGSAVAATLVSNRKVDGLILVTPFDSLKSVASDLYPWLPVDLFFQHEMDAAAALEDSSVPVAIIAGDRDEIVLPGRTDALRSKVGRLVFDRAISGAGHNDIYGRREFEEAMHEALGAVSQ
jgi:alpha/beta superfamily hydrolase